MSWRSSLEELVRATFPYAFTSNNGKIVVDDEEFYDDHGP